MRLSLPLLAAAALFSACDGTDPVEAFDGPTVEFATTSLAVTEDDGTVEIPVRLTNGDGGSVTVEVLYAAAASTTTFGEDVAEFGAEAGANRVATVTLSGATDLQTVTVAVQPDTLVEAPEAAVFVLQRASGTARIGRDREFQLQIGTPPLATTRARPDGDVVTVEGVVTGRFGRYTFLQDGTAGIAVYAFSDTNFGMADIEPGDRVQVRGSLSEFGARDGAGLGLKQIFVGRDSPATFRVLSEGNPLPDAQELTVAEILANGEDYESERVRVEGLTVINTTDVVFEAGGAIGNYTVTDGTGEMILRINNPSESEVGGTPVPQGSFTFTGALGQFGGAYQLTPLRATDLDLDD